ncbi:MAG: hypothetical protein GKR90_02615 [Pseudomonadales bacterium]|nr:hypothetical protein [Pseudomonadales bacterium]
MNKSVLVALITIIVPATSEAEEKASTVFAGLSMTYAQGLTPDGYVNKALGYKKNEPNWLETSDLLIKTQASMAKNMAQVLKSYSACDLKTWTNAPKKLASRIDAESNKIMKKHYQDSKKILSKASYETLMEWVEKNRARTTYTWLSEMETPSLEVLGMCERMIAQGEDL